MTGLVAVHGRSQNESGDTPCSSSNPKPARSRKAVLVHEPPETIDSLSALLMQLNRAAVPVVTSRLGQMPDPETSPNEFVAALVSDAMADPIGFCSSLPPALPKILIASDVTFDLRCAATRAGIDTIIRRPVDINELSDWLAHFEQSNLVEPISVLLVDDHVLTAELHAAVLQSAGMSVRIVTQPEEVLVALETALPDLILMDVRMPKVDGIELARIIRQSREFLAVPIAFLSAESDELRQMAARKCGGDDFIRKPVDLARLASLVRLRAERARSTRSLIERDSLTGLLNHGRFQDRATAELERSRRTGSTFSLAMLDLDHFKAVNDTYGHPVGDKVIRTLSRTLLGRLRATDVVGRYGGEEFAILLLDTPPDQARVVIDRIRIRFSEIIFDETAGRFSATFSAGLSSSLEETVSGLFTAADNALYEAKREGRNRIALAASPVLLSLPGAGGPYAARSRADVNA